MRSVTCTYNGPKARLRIRETGTVLPRGQAVQVTDREVDILAGSSADHTVHHDPPEAAAPPRVQHSGGPWFTVSVDGEIVDKVKGRDAAEARAAEIGGG